MRRLGKPAFPLAEAHGLLPLRLRSGERADAREHYTGLADGLPPRLRKHNEGGGPHTAKNRHWGGETAVAFRSREKAAAFDANLKSSLDREFARHPF